MTVRAVDLSGLYQISAVAAGRITLVNPAVSNPNWLHGDLSGAGTSGYAQNITMIETAGPEAANLDGTYLVDAVTPTQLTLHTPAAVSADWGVVPHYLNGQTSPLSASVSVSSGNWIGPFIVEDPTTAFLVSNVVALQGLFKDDGKSKTAFSISFEIEATPVDQTDTPTGPAQTFVGIVDGNSDGTSSLRAKTLICSLTNPGRQSVRCRRTTNSDYGFKGTVVDEIKWQDLFGMGPVDQPDFGNVTTAHTRTFATQNALSVKERKFNLLASRRVPIWTGGVTFGAAAATTDAAEIAVQICRDVALGNRGLNEIDIASIHDAVTAAKDYFGDASAGSFSYTFDDDNTSFEEMVSAVANACFCVPYRQGNQIKFLFEGPTADSTILFNHRNKMPGSETRTVRFGQPTDNDGIELDYVDAVTDPSIDSPATIYIPADRSAKKPQKITAYGVRSFKQAYWLAWRAYNKLIYQNTAVEFEALGEAAPSIRGERVLVADGTRADTQDGEVLGQVGLTLTLSQPVDLSGAGGYTIFLQLPDATVDAITVTAGASDDQVVLARAPRIGLALGEDLYARATYQLATSDAARSSAFLITDKSSQDNGNYQMECINYSSLFYQNDTLWLWLSFDNDSFDDASASRHDGAAAGGAVLVADGTRGNVYSGAAGRSVTFPPFLPPAASYTKAVWIKRADLVSNGGLLENANEHFNFTGANLVASHGGGSASAPWPDAANWHHAALVWDEPDGTLSIYIDGELADGQGGVAPRVAAQLTALSGFAGRADDVRLFSRALSDEEVRELYRGTRI